MWGGYIYKITRRRRRIANDVLVKVMNMRIRAYSHTKIQCSGDRSSSRLLASCNIYVRFGAPQRKRANQTDKIETSIHLNKMEWKKKFHSCMQSLHAMHESHFMNRSE